MIKGLIMTAASFSQKEKEEILIFCEQFPHETNNIIAILEKEQQIFDSIKAGYQNEFSMLQKAYMTAVSDDEKLRFEKRENMIKMSLKAMNAKEAKENNKAIGLEEFIQ